MKKPRHASRGAGGRGSGRLIAGAGGKDKESRRWVVISLKLTHYRRAIPLDGRTMDRADVVAHMKTGDDVDGLIRTLNTWKVQFAPMASIKQPPDNEDETANWGGSRWWPSIVADTQTC